MTGSAIEGNPVATGAAPRVSVVVPVFNKRDLLRQSLDSIVVAARRSGGVELIIVDHESTDGSSEIVRTYAGVATILSVGGGTISSVRNRGAHLAHGAILSFIDCDCVVPPDYFDALLGVFEGTGATAVGCECGIPTPGHWTERVWYELHVIRADGYRHYLNSANFAVRRDAFERLGGFDEALVVGEDTDICTRLVAAGHRIFEARCLSIVHLGNPKGARQFLRKEIWHGLAVLSGGRAMALNKASLMVFTHLAGVIVAALVLLWPGAGEVRSRVLTATALVLAVPVATVVYRFIETRRARHPVRAITLYLLFYTARVAALLSVLGRRFRQRPAPASARRGPNAPAR